jgi:hypothetical protein
MIESNSIQNLKIIAVLHTDLEARTVDPRITGLAASPATHVSCIKTGSLNWHIPSSAHQAFEEGCVRSQKRPIV